MSVLVTGIAELVTNDETLGRGILGVVHDAALVVHDGLIRWIGPSSSAPQADRCIDVNGRAVIPSFVDSHTHLVFEGDRSEEFTSRMAGKPYDGGGIDRTVALTRAADDARLRTGLDMRAHELAAQGTGTFEVKSGYSLDVEGEARLLALAGEVTPETTFLGGHVIAPEYRNMREEYIELVCTSMLRACAPHARWVDAFCEPGAPTALDEDEARAVLEAGRDAGLTPRVHGAQLQEGPGPRLAVEVGAASLDHATHLTDADIDLLAQAGADGPVVTFLPLVEFSTRQPFPDASRVVRAGVGVALASDCNPGTNASSSMSVAMGLAIREMGLTPEHALWAATEGGARALRREDVGHLAVGARAAHRGGGAVLGTHLLPLRGAVDADAPRRTRRRLDTGRQRPEPQSRMVRTRQ